MIDLPTPDFYRYPWIGLSSAQVADDAVVLEWPDGVTMRAHGLWLRENLFEVGIDPATREGLVDPADLAEATRVTGAEVTTDGALRVRWEPENRVGDFHPGWLRHVADGEARPEAWLPPAVVWESDLGAPPTTDGSTLDDVTLGRWVHDLVSHGIGRLRNVGCDRDLLAAVGPRIGGLRDTNFGRVWDVRAVVSPDSTANTTLRLGPHTDLPTRETPPGFQFLHCIENSCKGGWSRMTDGLAVAAHLEQHEPGVYEALTTLRWVFFNRGTDVDHRWSGPVIDLGVDGAPTTFRAFYPVRAFPAMADEDVGRAYAAIRRFSLLAADARFQIGFPFEPGDLVGFDNRRILHGRDGFDQGDGRRFLRGCYIDRDDVLSWLRVFNRRAAEVAE